MDSILHAQNIHPRVAVLKPIWKYLATPSRNNVDFVVRYVQQQKQLENRIVFWYVEWDCAASSQPSTLPDYFSFDNQVLRFRLRNDGMPPPISLIHAFCWSLKFYINMDSAKHFANIVFPEHTDMSALLLACLSTTLEVAQTKAEITENLKRISAFGGADSCQYGAYDLSRWKPSTARYFGYFLQHSSTPLDQRDQEYILKLVQISSSTTSLEHLQIAVSTCCIDDTLQVTQLDLGSYVPVAPSSSGTVLFSPGIGPQGKPLSVSKDVCLHIKSSSDPSIHAWFPFHAGYSADVLHASVQQLDTNAACDLPQDLKVVIILEPKNRNEIVADECVSSTGSMVPVGMSLGKEEFTRHHIVTPDPDLLDELQCHGFSQLDVSVALKMSSNDLFPAMGILRSHCTLKPSQINNQASLATIFVPDIDSRQSVMSSRCVSEAECDALSSSNLSGPACSSALPVLSEKVLKDRSRQHHSPRFSSSVSVRSYSSATSMSKMAGALPAHLTNRMFGTPGRMGAKSVISEPRGIGSASSRHTFRPPSARRDGRSSSRRVLSSKRRFLFASHSSDMAEGEDAKSVNCVSSSGVHTPRQGQPRSTLQRTLGAMPQSDAHLGFGDEISAAVCARPTSAIVLKGTSGSSSTAKPVAGSIAPVVGNSGPVGDVAKKMDEVEPVEVYSRFYHCLLHIHFTNHGTISHDINACFFVINQIVISIFDDLVV